MNDFQSKALQDLLAAHAQLNNLVKISTVAVDHLLRSETDAKKLSVLLNELILQSGERWTPRMIVNPAAELQKIKNDLVKSAIIWAYSAFDLYFKTCEGILSPSFSATKDDDTETNNVEEEQTEHKIIRLYNRLNWPTSNIDAVLIIFKFYEALRHAVAHNVGIPTDKLVEIADDAEFRLAITNWKTKFPKKTISPPPIVAMESISLQPHHAITFSETCLRIARDINDRMFTSLGLQYFIEKTIKKHLSDTAQLTAPVCKDLTRYLIYHLKQDYNISFKLYGDIWLNFKEQQIKDYKRRYQALNQ